MAQSARKPNTQNSQYNAQEFFINQILKQVNTAELVVVTAVNANSVDVKPLINGLSPDNISVESAIIYDLPFIRYQGGANAITITPQVGDIGLCVYCQRDISGVIATGQQSNPLSNRMFDCSDGVYVCSIASVMQAPKRYLEINDTQITISGDVPVVITASKTTINSDTEINGKLTVSGDVTAGGISLQNHVHGGVTGGSGTTGAPQ